MPAWVVQSTQQTVNNQTVCGTLMNLCDHPELVSLGEERREDGSNLETVRVPIIVTGNDLSRLYAPLLRDGRMEKWYWDPQFEDIVNMVDALFKDDPLWSIEDTRALVTKFPNQPLDFFGATRSTVYDDAIRNWMIGKSKKKNGYDVDLAKFDEKLALGTSGVDLFGNVGTDEAPLRLGIPRASGDCPVREDANHHGKRNGSCKRIIEPTRFGQLRKAISRVYEVAKESRGFNPGRKRSYGS